MGTFTAQFMLLFLLAISPDIESSHIVQTSDIKTKMEKHRVVPDIIPSAPSDTITVKYGAETVNLGNELTPTQVHDKPTISWPVENDAYYTLIMNDPDVPQHIAKEVQHWLVVNIPGTDINKGNTLFDYVGSGPPKGTGLHRYIFLVYKQEKLLPSDQYQDIRDVKIESRREHQLKNLITRFDLKTLVAGNFFIAQFDDNVPKYYEERMKKYAKL